MTAYFTEGEWMPVHVWAGYGVFGLLAFRLVWGMIGPRPARFSDFVYRPRTVVRYCFAVFRRNADRYLGHNPAGGAMIIALLLLTFVTTVSGMLMQGTGEAGIEFIEETHEFAANATMALVVIHILGVIWESLLHRENLIKAMITGRKRAENAKSTSY